MVHTLAILFVIYLVVHFIFSGHRYTTSRRHRSWLHRVYISLPGPWGWRMGHRL